MGRKSRFSNLILLTGITAMTSVACSSVQASTPESFAHNKSGIALYNQGKVKEAIEEFKKAVSLDPKNADYHRNLSAIYQGQNMLPEALKEAEAAFKAKPSDLRNAEQAGALSVLQKKFVEGEKYFRAAMKLAKGDAVSPYRIQALNCLKDQGKQAPYVAEVKETVKKNPKDVGALQLLAKVYLDEKKTQDAENAAREAVKLAPKDYTSHLSLAQVLQTRTKDKEAVKEYETVLTMKPDHPQAKMIKDAIEYINSKVERSGQR